MINLLIWPQKWNTVMPNLKGTGPLIFHLFEHFDIHWRPYVLKSESQTLICDSLLRTYVLIWLELEGHNSWFHAIGHMSLFVSRKFHIFEKCNDQCFFNCADRIALKEIALFSLFSREQSLTKTKYENAAITFHVMKFSAKYDKILETDIFLWFLIKILMSALALMCIVYKFFQRSPLVPLPLLKGCIILHN